MVDEDCDQYLGRCDMSRGVCALPSLAEMENSYLKCYLAEMSSSTEYYIRHQVLADSLQGFPRNSSEFFFAVRQAAAVADCVDPSSPLDISRRSRYIWDAQSIDCQVAQLGNLTNVTDSFVKSLCPPVFCLGKKDFIS
jgi:glutamate mutase epsilon subunit